MVTILAALPSDRSFSLTFNVRVHDRGIFISFSEHNFVMQIHFFRLLPRRCLQCTMRCRKPDPFDAFFHRLQTCRSQKPKIRVLTKSMQRDTKALVFCETCRTRYPSAWFLYILVKSEPCRIISNMQFSVIKTFQVWYHLPPEWHLRVWPLVSWTCRISNALPMKI